MKIMRIKPKPAHNRLCQTFIAIILIRFTYLLNQTHYNKPWFSFSWPQNVNDIRLVFYIRGDGQEMLIGDARQATLSNVRSFVGHDGQRSVALEK